MDKKKILVVEDEKAIADILVFNLGREGYDTMAAYDGAEGLHKALTESPDLILLDVILSEESCASAVERKPLYRINIPYHSPFHNTKTVGLHRKNGRKTGFVSQYKTSYQKMKKQTKKTAFAVYNRLHR